MTKLICTDCGQTYALDTERWRCECGGAFELSELPSFDRDAIDRRQFSLWRYAAALPLSAPDPSLSLGEGLTPLIQIKAFGLELWCKLEFLAPTGSFKDRGTAVLVSHLKAMGVSRVVEDSSGNAAASLAAYCARANIQAQIFVPAYASPGKLRQIELYGAELVPVEGPRDNAAKAAQQAANKSYYASHYYNPIGLAGMATFAYELAEQLGWRAPDNVLFPVGHGTFLLGTYLGFKQLVQAGLIERMPRLFAVQARSCAPLFAAWSREMEDVPEIAPGETIAEGIRIARPPRAARLLQAIRETGGAVLAVDDTEIRWAQDALARQGLYVEPTSAVPIAALRKLDKVIGQDELTVVPLTGSGLKTS
jgi:threonine synthase